MATTKVTLQIEPFDLQLICDGLALYRTVMSALEDGVTPLGLGDRVSDLRLPIYNGDPGYCHGQANRLLAVMGLRSGDDRNPQLRMWGDDRVDGGEELPESALSSGEIEAVVVELEKTAEEDTGATMSEGEQPWYSD